MQNKFLCTALSLSGSFAHQSPPEGVGETPEHFVLVLLDEVDEERGEDEAEEADVEGGDQLLSVSIDDRPKKLPSATSPIHSHHPQDLKEPQAPQCRCSVHLVAFAREDNHGGTDGDDIYHTERGLDESHPAEDALVTRATARRPEAYDEFHPEPEHHNDLKTN